MQTKRILGIETTCDETACAIVENGRIVLADVISSQIALHQEYGGVVPELASRKHVENLIDVLHTCLTQAELDLKCLDGVAVSYGPGLVGALLTGISMAKALSWSLDIPLLAVNHIEAHIYANFIDHDDISPPLIALVVSGGHSHILHMKDFGVFEVLGRTRDDAVGEAFDKTARVLGLGYPGGPKMEACAKQSRAPDLGFPRTYFEDSLDFSFSGIKTAVLNYVNSCKMKNEKVDKAQVAASFQQAVTDVLVHNTICAAKQTGERTLCIAGGVSANLLLRESMRQAALESGMRVVYPRQSLCTDNAAMVAGLGYQVYCNKQYADMTLNAQPNLQIGLQPSA